MFILNCSEKKSQSYHHGKFRVREGFLLVLSCHLLLRNSALFFAVKYLWLIPPVCLTKIQFCTLFDGWSKSSQLTLPVVSLSALTATPLSLFLLCLFQSASLSWPSVWCGRVCLFVPQYVCVCLSLSWAIRIISNLLNRSSSDWTKSEGPVWGSCLFGRACVHVCACLAVFLELYVPKDHRLARTVLLCHNYRKTHCKQGKGVCMYFGCGLTV